MHPFDHEKVFDRIDRCLGHRERLTVGEIEVLHALLARQDLRQSITFVEEQQLKQMEQKLGLT